MSEYTLTQVFPGDKTTLAQIDALCFIMSDTKIGNSVING